MYLRQPFRHRKGATVVECALVYPVVFVMFIGLIVGGMGVFRYQECASLARQAARFASTHAGKYASENPNATTVDKNYIITNVIKTHAYVLDTSKLSTTININNSSGSYDWDTTSSTNNRWPYSYVSSSGVYQQITNTVTVTVTYTWVPECYLVGPISLTSTSTMPMCY